MKSLILLLFIFGLVFLIVGYMENNKKCPLPKIEYRYIPRNFYEEQVSQPDLRNTYSDLFNKADTWSRYPLGDVNNNNPGVSKNINNFIESDSLPNLDETSLKPNSDFKIEKISF